MKVYLRNNDRYIIDLYTQQEANDWFCYTDEDMNADVTQEFLERYKRIEKDFREIQIELKKLLGEY
jgi:hypothetical protein